MTHLHRTKSVLAIAAAALTLTVSTASESRAQDVFIGELLSFAGNFCPRGYMEANGSLLPIANYNALFSLLGTNFGGDGRTTFGVPDLRGRVAVNDGSAPGLTPRTIGNMYGAATVTLTEGQMPPHTHTANGNSQGASETAPASNSLAVPVSSMGPEIGYSSDVGAATATLNTATVGLTGGGQPHDNLAPYLANTWCIAVTGIYPSRP